MKIDLIKDLPKPEAMPVGLQLVFVFESNERETVTWDGTQFVDTLGDVVQFEGGKYFLEDEPEDCADWWFYKDTKDDPRRDSKL